MSNFKVNKVNAKYHKRLAPTLFNFKDDDAKYQKVLTPIATKVVVTQLPLQGVAKTPVKDGIDCGELEMNLQVCQTELSEHAECVFNYKGDKMNAKYQ